MQKLRENRFWALKRRQINFWLIELTKKFMFMLQISVHKPQQPNRTSIAPKSTMKVINNTCSMLALIFTIQFHASYKYSATTCLSWERKKNQNLFLKCTISWNISMTETRYSIWPTFGSLRESHTSHIHFTQKHFSLLWIKLFHTLLLWSCFMLFNKQKICSQMCDENIKIMKKINWKGNKQQSIYSTQHCITIKHGTKNFSLFQSRSCSWTLNWSFSITFFFLLWIK